MSDVEEIAVEIASSFVGVLAPLARLSSSPSELEGVLDDLGWRVEPGTDLAGVRSAIDIGGDLERILDSLGTLDTGDVGSVLNAIGAIARTTDRVRGLIVGPSDMSRFPAPFNSTAFWGTFPVDLLELLTVQTLERRLPVLAALLGFVGVIDDTPVAAAPPRGAYRRRSLDLEALASLLSDPAGHFRTRYGWGDGRVLEHDRLLRVLRELMLLIGPSEIRHPREGVVATYWSPDAPARPALRELTGNLFTAFDGSSQDLLRLDASVLPIPGLGTPDGDPVGVALSLDSTLAASLQQTLPLGPLTLSLEGGLQARGELVVELRPGTIEAHGSGEVTALQAAVTIARDVPFLLLGLPGATRLEISGLAVRVGIGGPPDDLEVTVSVNIRGLLFVLQAGSADSFLQHLFGSEPQTLSVDLDLGWSSKTGLRFAAAGAIRIVAPVDLQLGPIRIDLVSVALAAATDAPVALSVAVSGGVALGPFAVSVAQVGTQARLSSRAADEAAGSLGGLDLSFGFKPPTGIGLAISTPAVSGGGFLELDTDAGRYTGVFELTIVEVVSVKVIAIITTKLPDGSPGFALLLIITAEGFTPVQLGMGFVLTGVGGLLALNRTIDVDAVRGGLRNGILDSVLFVKDPVRNAPRVIAALDRVFPLAPDRLLIGPLAEIGWGSPPIVKIRLALLLEIPQPVRIVLLAALGVVLPDEDAPVLELHVDAIGVLDLARGELALDASLHHSRLWKFALSGDLALRLNWGDDPQFLLSVGGFHPRYAPPAGLRRLERLAFTLTDSDNPRVRFETYMALTSNTIQMGARVSVRAEAGGFGIDGGGAFDALVQWVPFGIDVSFEAWVRVFSPAATLLAARVALNVTGPQPWHVTGVAEVQLLWFKVQVGVDFTIGEPTPPEALDTVDVAGLLWTELGNRESWQAALGPRVSVGVTLQVDVAGPDAPLVAHPLAMVRVQQKVVPLGVPVTRIGVLLPQDGARRYELDVDVPTGVRVDAVNERFAPAQFMDIPDDEKLTGRSFEDLAAGVSLAPEEAVSVPLDRVVGADLAFETRELTDLGSPAAPGARALAPSELLDTGTHPVRPRAAWEVVTT